jgi:hypothetical protein
VRQSKIAKAISCQIREATDCEKISNKNINLPVELFGSYTSLISYVV